MVSAKTEYCHQVLLRVHSSRIFFPSPAIGPYWTHSFEKRFPENDNKTYGVGLMSTTQDNTKPLGSGPIDLNAEI